MAQFFIALHNNLGMLLWGAEMTVLVSGAAILLGVPLSMLVAFSPLMRRTFYPLAVTLEMVPKIVFAEPGGARREIDAPLGITLISASRRSTTAAAHQRAGAAVRSGRARPEGVPPLPQPAR